MPDTSNHDNTGSGAAGAGIATLLSRIGGASYGTSGSTGLGSMVGDSSAFLSLVSALMQGVPGAAPSPATAAAGTSTAWPRLQRAPVISRLKQLRGNANLVNQGAFGLCSAAAFYHHIIQRDANQFYLFAEQLYETGSGQIGQLVVAPGQDLRSASYTELKKKHPDIPPEADWMILAALRDSENWIIDFEGSPEEDGGTLLSELGGWYEKTRLYQTVEHGLDGTLAGAKAVSKGTRNHIVLFVETALVEATATGRHFVTLEGPLLIDEAKDAVSFDCWTWGEASPRKIKTTLAGFLDHYLGVVTASF